MCRIFAWYLGSVGRDLHVLARQLGLQARGKRPQHLRVARQGIVRQGHGPQHAKAGRRSTSVSWRMSC